MVVVCRVLSFVIVCSTFIRSFLLNGILSYDRAYHSRISSKVFYACHTYSRIIYYIFEDFKNFYCKISHFPNVYHIKNKTVCMATQHKTFSSCDYKNIGKNLNNYCTESEANILLHGTWYTDWSLKYLWYR